MVGGSLDQDIFPNVMVGKQASNRFGSAPYYRSLWAPASQVAGLQGGISVLFLDGGNRSIKYFLLVGIIEGRMIYPDCEAVHVHRFIEHIPVRCRLIV